MALQMIKSGGQTGADMGGLDAARHLGIPTGGHAPYGWRICLPDGTDGSNPQLADYGLVEHESREYPPRTKLNAQNSDGTVWFGYDRSPGAKLTIKSVKAASKHLIINPTPEDLLLWCERNNIEVLNVAGNRESDDNPGIYQRTYDAIVEAFTFS